ncbi:MAG: ATP-binding protein [Candidatus Krumholzibacteriia bacterium]
MIARHHHLDRVRQLLAANPVVAILGARQVGKTTLSRQIAAGQSGPVTRFDLEDPDDLARLEEPKLALGDLRGLIVLDEVQRRPDLFPLLRVLADRSDAPARFLVLGSASPDLLRQSSETLAGRIAYHELGGFGLAEVEEDCGEKLWLRGGFPRAFLAADEGLSFAWRRDFLQTFLERDIPQLGFRVPAETLHRFWRMLAHYHAQTWNGAELARAFGVTAATVRRYLDILSGSLVVWQLPPWHENIGKRQVRAPKVYVADSGLLHVLLGVETRDDLLGHPKVGASWEGHVLRELIARLGARREECYYWGTHAGAELDLLIVRGGHRLGFEVKRTTAPHTTKSLHAARESLDLDEIFVIHAGETSFALGEGTRAVAFRRIRDDLPAL